MIEAYYTTKKDDKTELTEAGGYPVDELANIMPLIPVSVEDLIKSISRNGLRVPITTVDGKIVDGRCRAIACAAAGVEPRFDEVGHLDRVEIYELVLDLNNRRNISQAQKAMIAAYEVRDGRHIVIGIKNAIEYAKEIWGVGKNTYIAAKYILTYGAVYASEIKQTGYTTIDGTSMSMNKAYKYLKAKQNKRASDTTGDGDEEVAKCIKSLRASRDSLAVSFNKEVLDIAFSILASEGANND